MISLKLSTSTNSKREASSSHNFKSLFWLLIIVAAITGSRLALVFISSASVYCAIEVTAD